LGFQIANDEALVQGFLLWGSRGVDELKARNEFLYFLQILVDRRL